ncbi:MAG: hypothetical protein V2B13_04270, partial [Pseudomonadota bacterium]
MKLEILIAIIAASSALCGVVISQVISLFQMFLSRRHEKQKLLRQKYEEMMFHFSASLEWIRYLNGSTTQSEVFALAQSTDARKALSLCLLYFPSLVQPANNYILAQQAYYTSVVTSFKMDIPVTAGGQALIHNKQQHEAVTNSLFE